MRNVSLLLTLILAFTTPANLRAEDAPAEGPKTGAFDISFEKRSKESDPRALGRVFDIAARDRADYDLKMESFHVYVPEDYEPGVPHGLLVALSSEIGDDGRPPAEYQPVLKQLKLIWVGASKADPEATDQRRLGLPLDAVENMKAKYTIDTDRIYITGVGRGGISASKLGLNYPQIFNGGIYFQGAAYYRDLIQGNTRYLADIPPPGGGEMRLAKQKSRLIFVVGAAGRIKEFVSVVFEKGYKAEKFEYAQYIAIENMGDTFPGSGAFEKGVKAADSVLAATDKAEWATGLRQERSRKYGDAFAAFNKVILRTESDKLREEAQKKLEGLRKMRDTQIAGAKEAIAGGNKALAKASLDRLTREWGELAGSEVATLLESVADAPRGTPTRVPPKTVPRPEPAKDPKVLEQEAGLLLAQAKKAIDEGDFDNARNKLKQIIEDYAKTGSLQQAKDLLAAIGEE